MRKFRTLRHPGVIRVLDTVEVTMEDITHLTLALSRGSVAYSSTP